MSGGKQPSFRLQIKYNGQRYDFGVAWGSDRFPGLHDVTFQVGDVAHEKFPKMDAMKALQLANQRTPDGKRVAFVSLSAPKAPGRPSHNLPPFNPGGGGFSDDPDVPF